MRVPKSDSLRRIYLCVVLLHAIICVTGQDEPTPAPRGGRESPKWKLWPADRVAISESGKLATQIGDQQWSLTTTGDELTEGRHYWEVELVGEETVRKIIAENASLILANQTTRRTFTSECAGQVSTSEFATVGVRA